MLRDREGGWSEECVSSFGAQGALFIPALAALEENVYVDAEGKGQQFVDSSALRVASRWKQPYQTKCSGK